MSVMLVNKNFKIDGSGGAFCYLLFLFAFPVSTVSGLEVFDKTILSINDTEFHLEIAKTRSQRSQGLMFRNHLSASGGMLFVYPQSGDHRIWMKNTLIPLTVIWLDENETVIGVKQLSPCDTEYCPSFGVSKSSKFVIELKIGISGIKPGDKILGLKSVE